jgi:hypothetical protein
MLNLEAVVIRATNMTTFAKESKKVKLKGYIRDNWGAPLIIAFIILLLSAACSLSIGLSSFADTLAVYAFYALVMGVALQLFCYLRYQKTDHPEAI